MQYDELLQRVAEHVALLYAEHPDPRLVYHNQKHITQTVNTVKKMSAWYKLNERDHFIVCAAAWFHDAGFLCSETNDHETKSAALAAKYLQTLSLDETTIDEVSRCILATRLPQSAVSLPEQILCDADLFNLGTPDFKESNRRVRKEHEELDGTKIKGREWREKTINLLEAHTYYTEYCRLLLDETKAVHLEELKRKQEEKLSETTEDLPAGQPTVEKVAGVANADTSKKNKKLKPPGRGIQTMFRVSFAAHQQLSALADNKAHIMISVNSIVISVTFGLVLRNFSTDSYHLVIPTVLLLLVNVTTIIFSVLATRPKIHPGFFTREQLKEKKVNLLFYGSFYKMKYDAYEEGMRNMMDDPDFLYGTMIKDIYWQGRVMGRKFRLLHISYNIFMYGIALVVISYFIAAILAL